MTTTPISDASIEISGPLGLKVVPYHVARKLEIDEFNKLNQTLFAQIEQMSEYIQHTLNAVDNLSDMPVSERWAKKWVDKAIEMLERNNYFRGLSPDAREEKPPVNPEEVYSPHAVIVDDKCRKCAGQMRDGKAITQTSTGIPDFAGGAVVTMFADGPGKWIDCMKCQDCGWSVSK